MWMACSARSARSTWASRASLVTAGLPKFLAAQKLCELVVGAVVIGEFDDIARGLEPRPGARADLGRGGIDVGHGHWPHLATAHRVGHRQLRCAVANVGEVGAG